MAAGYNEWAGTGGSEMFFHNGLAARGAVTAVQLAAEGAYASRTALDGDAGLLAAFRRPRPPQVPELFEDRPEILAVFFKPVPACNFAQTPAQVALALAQREESALPTSTASACASRRPRPSTPAATRADRSSTFCKRR